MEPRTTVPCGCGVETPAEAVEPGPRMAVAVDPEIQHAVLNRLRRIEGQVRGLQRMVEEQRWCADIVTQMASVQEALRSAARALLQNHLRHCATAAIRSGDPEEAEAMYQELVGMMQRMG